MLCSRRKSVPDAIPMPVGEAAYSATDLLHRRTPLVHRFHAGMDGTCVEVDTNSPWMGHAIRAFEARNACYGHKWAKWEIEVEVRGEEESCSSPMDEESGYETCSFGPSRSCRMEDGSWFAHTPPSIDGVGFVLVTGDGFRQAAKLKLYLDLVSRLVLQVDAFGLRAKDGGAAA